jgi:hypothetical protein
MTMAIAALPRPGPSAAVTAMASRIGGNESVTSTSRMMMLSTRPPTKPAIAPSVPPMTTAQKITSAAIGKEWRTPYSVRVSTSRPSASVPSQCEAFGGWKRPPASIVGS